MQISKNKTTTKKALLSHIEAHSDLKNILVHKMSKPPKHVVANIPHNASWELLVARSSLSASDWELQVRGWEIRDQESAMFKIYINWLNSAHSESALHCLQWWTVTKAFTQVQYSATCTSLGYLIFLIHLESTVFQRESFDTWNYFL